MPIVNNSIITNINFQVYLRDNKRYFTPIKIETLDTSSEKHNKKRQNPYSSSVQLILKEVIVCL